MTYCTPYLLQLGLTKSKVSLVWIAGPLSGLIMQPIVGIIADQSRSRWGRRRPYMVGGTVVVTLSLMLLGWTSEFVNVFFPASKIETRRELTVMLAVFSIYGVDFAINAVQALARSLIIDTLPRNKQQVGSAWALRMVAVGSLIGYAVGAIDLATVFGTTLGNTQFKQLIITSALALIACVSLTCWAVHEPALARSPSKGTSADTLSIGSMMSQIVRTAQRLPSRISVICRITFCSWIEWFSFLFYSTTWIGEVYLRYNAPAKAREHRDSLGQIGRVGSMALITFSVVTFAASVLLPWLVESPEDAEEFTPRPSRRVRGALLEMRKWKPSLLTA